MRILIGGGGSAAAATAIDLVAATRWLPSDQIRVLHATPTRTVSRVAWFADADRNAASVHAECVANRDLDRLLPALIRLEATGARVEIATGFGRAPAVLAQASRTFGPDLLVVGAAIRARISASLHACVARDVLARSMVPVLVARTPRTDRVLLVADGTPAALAAEELLTRLPLTARAHVRVLVVIAGSSPPDRAGQEHIPATAESRAARDAAGRLRAEGLDGHDVVRSGDLAASVIDEARTWRADLVVVGTNEAGWWARLRAGRLIRRLMGETSASLLVVPTPSAARAAPAAVPPVTVRSLP